MFKELNDNLTSIEGEVTKLKTAVEHIDQSKEAAKEAVNVSVTVNTNIKELLQKVEIGFDTILKPHQDLITATEKLTKTISEIDFPTRLDKQDKELKTNRIILLIGFGILIVVVLVYIIKHW